MKIAPPVLSSSFSAPKQTRGSHSGTDPSKIIWVNMDAAAMAAQLISKSVDAAPAATCALETDLFGRVEHVVNSFCPGLAKMPYHVDRFGGGHHGHEHSHYVLGTW